VADFVFGCADVGAGRPQSARAANAESGVFVANAADAVPAAAERPAGGQPPLSAAQ